MRRSRSRRNREMMVVLGSLTLLLGVVNTAAAAPPTVEPPNLALKTPVAFCDGPDEVTVTASLVDEDVELTGFSMWVARWEYVDIAVPDDFNGLGQVENWSADFWTSERKGQPTPTSHTLTTGNSATWHWHSWREEGHTDASDLFVVSVNAYVAGKGNTEGRAEWDSWVIDCTERYGKEAVVGPFVSQWDAPWKSEQGEL